MFLKKLFCHLFDILESSWGFTWEGILTNCVVNWALVVLLPCLGRIFPAYLLLLSHVVWPLVTGIFLGGFSQLGSSRMMTLFHLSGLSLKNNRRFTSSHYGASEQQGLRIIQEMKGFQVVSWFLATLARLPSLGAWD